MTRRGRSAAATRRSRSWSPTAGEKEIHPRLRGHGKRVLLALRGTDYYYVPAFALEVLRGVDFAGRGFASRPCWLFHGTYANNHNHG